LRKWKRGRKSVKGRGEYNENVLERERREGISGESGYVRVGE